MFLCVWVEHPEIQMKAGLIGGVFLLLIQYRSGLIILNKYLKQQRCAAIINVVDASACGIVLLGASYGLHLGTMKAKNILSLADWRQVNMGTEERIMFEKRDFESSQNMTSLLHEKDELQNELYLTQAIELRNKAQLESFVDAEAQWNSQTEAEKYFLQRKEFVEERLTEIDYILKSEQ